MAGCHGATRCTSCPRAATPLAIGSMKLPTPSPGKRGYDVATITTTWRISGPRRFQATSAQDQLPGRQQRLDEHGARHLGIAFGSLHEDNRHLADAQAVVAR